MLVIIEKVKKKNLIKIRYFYVFVQCGIVPWQDGAESQQIIIKYRKSKSVEDDVMTHF